MKKIKTTKTAPGQAPAPQTVAAAEIVRVQKQAQDYLAGWQRAQADYANFRKRTEAERAILIRAAATQLIVGVLPVLDNLEQAASLAKKSAVKNRATVETIQQLAQGTDLIAQKLRAVLAAEGVSAIKSVGQKFDPALHEAVASVPGKKDIVVAEHAPGYKLAERVLRPSQVSVGNGAAN